MDAEALRSALGDGRPGTYILCIELSAPCRITIGKLGRFSFDRGFYYYVGSAFGPGGVAARCRHHINTEHRPRWHIDYLRKQGRLSCILFSTHAQRLEHAWAHRLQASDGYHIAVPRFGASDCRCDSHLFHSKQARDPSLLTGTHTETYRPVT